MSGKNNVNPNHYKVAGRERQGEDIVYEREKQQAGLAAAARRREAANFIPGTALPGGVAARLEPEPARRARMEARPRTSSRQHAAAHRNIRKAAAAAQRQQTSKICPRRLGSRSARKPRRARRRTAA